MSLLQRNDLQDPDRLVACHPSKVGACRQAEAEAVMSLLILPPDQARAVVGEGDQTHWFRVERASDGENSIVAHPLARFIPADAADAWPVGEWVEVQKQEPYEGFDPLNLGLHVWRPVGRVRLGEPILIGTVPYHGPHTEPVTFPFVEINGDRLTYWWHHDAGFDDITRPHLDLWPDAWTPGSWAFPIIAREAL